jgi:hypothetical protein
MRARAFARQLGDRSCTWGWCGLGLRLRIACYFCSALSGVPPVAQTAGALVALGFPRSLRFPPGAPQTRAICFAATRSNSGAPTAPSQPRALGWPIALLPAHPARLETAGDCGERKAAFQPARSLRRERTVCHVERTSALHVALALRGAVWAGRAIGRAERDEVEAGFRSESSEPSASGHSSKPPATEGFAKAAAGRGRCARLVHTTQKRSNEQQFLKAEHPKALSTQNNPRSKNASAGARALLFFTAVNF